MAFHVGIEPEKIIELLAGFTGIDRRIMLKGKIGRLEDRIDSLTQTNAEFKQYTDKQRAKDKSKNDQLIVDLEKAKAQAITDGDGIAALHDR